MQMASVLFLGIPGPKMVWQFGELGYDYSILSNGGRTSSKPPRWDYWNQPARQELYRVYAAMANLRKSDAFRFGNFTSDLAGMGKRIWISHSSMNVVIAANMNVSGLDMAPGFQNAGLWYDYFTGQTITITDPVNQSFAFGPGEYRVFTNVKLAKPFHHLALTVNDSLTGLPVTNASITVEGAGTQLSDLTGKATFTSSPQTVLIKVIKPEYRTYTYPVEVNNDLEKTIRLKPVSGAGIENLTDQESVYLYPNPAKDRITIVADQKYIISCIGLDGRLLFQHPMNNLNEAIDISALAKGVYLLRFRNDSGSFYKNIVVQ
jgi:hypothetical protein